MTRTCARCPTPLDATIRGVLCWPCWRADRANATFKSDVRVDLRVPTRRRRDRVGTPEPRYFGAARQRLPRLLTPLLVDSTGLVITEADSTA